jgi:hypothetical protein
LAATTHAEILKRHINALAPAYRAAELQRLEKQAPELYKALSHYINSNAGEGSAAAAAAGETRCMLLPTVNLLQTAVASVRLGLRCMHTSINSLWHNRGAEHNV